MSEQTKPEAPAGVEGCRREKTGTSLDIAKAIAEFMRDAHLAAEKSEPFRQHARYCGQCRKRIFCKAGLALVRGVSR